MRDKKTTGIDVPAMLRLMAWERAKGEMLSIIKAYPSSDDYDEIFDEFNNRVHAFIDDIEERYII